MREIPKKNYLILFIIAIVVVIATGILMNIYNANHEVVYESKIKTIVTEIKYEDLSNYLIENPNVVVYVNNSHKDNNKLESDIYKLIADKNIQQYMIYMERNKDIVDKYKLPKNNPLFIAFKDGKKVEIFSEKEYTIEGIESFLVRNEVIEK